MEYLTVYCTITSQSLTIPSRPTLSLLIAHRFVFSFSPSTSTATAKDHQRKRRKQDRNKINDPRKKSFHTAIDINLLIINYIKTREYITIIRSRSRHGERDKCSAEGYSYTLWCNICKLPVSLLDIDLFTIFSQTNFLPFSIIAAPRRSPNSDSFYFLTLFSFFLAASPARCLFARSSEQKG